MILTEKNHLAFLTFSREPEKNANYFVKQQMWSIISTDLDNKAQLNSVGCLHEDLLNSLTLVILEVKKCSFLQHLLISEVWPFMMYHLNIIWVWGVAQ